MNLKVPSLPKLKKSDKGETKMEKKAKYVPKSQQANLRCVSYIGASLILMVSGCLFMFELEHSYIWSFFYYNRCTCNDMLPSFYVYVLAFISYISGLFLGAILFNYFQISIKWLILMTAVLQLGSMSFVLMPKKILTANLMYNSLFGLGSGTNLVLCLECLWEHNYSKRGLITGFVQGFYWFGSFVFPRLTELILNPKKVLPDERFYYPKEIADNVPRAGKILLMILSLFTLLGICMIERVKRKVLIQVQCMETLTTSTID